MSFPSPPTIPASPPTLTTPALLALASPTSTPSSNPNSPLAALNVSTYSTTGFTYPSDIGSEGKNHYMVFHINESEHTQIKNFNVATNSPYGVTNPTGESTIAANQAIDTNNHTFQSVPRSTNRVSTTIVLYMPQLTSTYTVDWQDSQFGAVSSLSNFNSLKNQAGITEALGDIVASFGASFVANAGKFLDTFTQANVSDPLKLANRVQINDHLECIFNGMGFRHFQFNWRFTPTSEEEAINVYNIIKAFKYHSAPEILQGVAGRFWIYPAEFDMQFYSNGVENEFLNKISTCALTSVNVNYSPNGHFSAHRPTQGPPIGSPSVCTDMSLTFVELELMTKLRIKDGF